MPASEWLTKPTHPALAPNLVDYAAECAAFRWEEAERALDGLPGARGLNIAHEAVDRHAAGPRARGARRCAGCRAAAPPWISATPTLAARTSRFANVLAALGVASRRARLRAARRASPSSTSRRSARSKHRAVFCPLFSAFGPEPVRQRLALGAGRVLVTTERALPAQGRGAAQRAARSSRTCCCVRDERGPAAARHARPATHSSRPPSPALRDRPDRPRGPRAAPLHERHDRHAEGRAARPPAPWSPTTPPARFALDLHDGRRVLVYGRPGLGHRHLVRDRRAARCTASRCVVDEADFDAERWYRILQDAARERLVHGADGDPHADEGGRRAAAQRFDLSALRFVASVGEPLNAGGGASGASDALGLPIHDNWWQTETGGIMIANFAGAEIRPGSMGRPLPGIEAAIVQRREDGGARARSRRPTRRASSRCARAGRRCSAPTSARRSATASASATAGTCRAISRAATPTATSGSSAAPTT